MAAITETQRMAINTEAWHNIMDQMTGQSDAAPVLMPQVGQGHRNDEFMLVRKLTVTRYFWTKLNNKFFISNHGIAYIKKVCCHMFQE